MRWILPAALALGLGALTACTSPSEDTLTESMVDAGEVTLAVTGMT